MSTAESDAAVRRALDALEQRTAEWPGPCRACAHVRVDSLMRSYSDWDTCAHPVEYALSFKPDKGFGHQLPRCGAVRGNSGRCGPDGKMFQPRPPGLLRRIATWFRST